MPRAARCSSGCGGSKPLRRRRRQLAERGTLVHEARRRSAAPRPADRVAAAAQGGMDRAHRRRADLAQPGLLSPISRRRRRGRTVGRLRADARRRRYRRPRRAGRQTSESSNSCRCTTTELPCVQPRSAAAHDTVEWAFERALAFDLRVGEHEYKKEWTSRRVWLCRTTSRTRRSGRWRSPCAPRSGGSRARSAPAIRDGWKQGRTTVAGLGFRRGRPEPARAPGTAASRRRYPAAPPGPR